MRTVVDTNVMVSGLITPLGPCGDIVRMVASGYLTLCVDFRILFEYKDVLKRPRLKIDNKLIDSIMKYIESTSEIHGTVPLRESLPDPDDCQFLEVAISSKAEYLITGNLKHFPANLRCGVNVLSPRDFLDALRSV